MKRSASLGPPLPKLRPGGENKSIVNNLISTLTPNAGSRGGGRFSRSASGVVERDPSAQKAKEVFEERIQPLGAEHPTMAKLVRSYTLKETTNRPMGPKSYKNSKPVLLRPKDICQGAGAHK